MLKNRHAIKEVTKLDSAHFHYVKFMILALMASIYLF